MDGITDSVFRQIVAKHGKPDVMFTEFISCDGLCSQGKEKLLPSLTFSQIERPLVIQFFGSKPENFYHCARLARRLGFDGVDINMGCSYKNIISQGAGSALIKNPKLAQEIILATREGANELPVSIKTRIGFLSNEIETWLPVLLDTKPAVITVHARTAKEMYQESALDWTAVKLAVDIRDSMHSETYILGNGGIHNKEEARQCIQESEIDGVMVGRAAIGNPWFFHQSFQKQNLSFEQIASVLFEHAELFETFYNHKRNFSLLKKHFAAYISHYPNARVLRSELRLIQNF